MSIISKKGSVLTIILFMLLSSNYSTSGSVELIPMQLIGEDTLGDGSAFGYDISSAYAASFNGLLMITVVYEEIGDWWLYSNATLRSSNGDLYLIMAVSNHISIVEATSLEDDSLSANHESYFSYEETWRSYTNLTEFTFFVDWSDIGGEGAVDLVFWTGRPIDNPDKLPNTGHLSFDGVQSEDKIGYFGDISIPTTSIIDETVTQTSGSSSQPNFIPILVLIGFFVVFIAGIFFYKSSYSKTRSNVSSKQKLTRTQIGKSITNNALCNSCGTNNPRHSSFCMECGVFIGT